LSIHGGLKKLGPCLTGKKIYLGTRELIKREARPEGEKRGWLLVLSGGGGRGNNKETPGR